MFIILYPNFIRNFGRYVVYLNIGSWANHFKSYPKNYFKVALYDRKIKIIGLII